MHVQRSKRLSPAFVVAMIALFVALGGTAGAVVTATVPLAKRALMADNAKKLGGKTSTQIVSQASKAAQTAAQVPGPASTAAGLVTIKTQAGQIAAGAAQGFTVACDAGQKVVGGGFSSNEIVLAFDSHPSNDTTWSVFLGNLDESAPASVSVYATCLR
jgi:hypothetical protein